MVRLVTTETRQQLQEISVVRSVTTEITQHSEELAVVRLDTFGIR